MVSIPKNKVLAILAILIASGLVVFLYSTPPAEWVRAKRLGEFIEAKGALGVLVFFLVTTISTTVGFPRQFFAFAAGFAFGVSVGVLLSSLAAICGCYITFYCSRRWLSQHIKFRYPAVVTGLNNLLVEDVFLKILILRLQPLGTNMITNLCAGVTSIKPKVFLTSSWLGYLPQMLVFSLLGAGVRIGSNAYLFYSSSMLCLTLIGGGWLYKRYIGQAAGNKAD